MGGACTLRIDDPATHASFLQWVVSAEADVAAGGSITLTITRTTGGVPPANPDTLTLTVYDRGSSAVRTYALNPTSASQQVTFSFTFDGNAGTGDRADTVRIDLRATRTSVGTYDVETDGTPNTPPTGFHTHTATRGWARSTTTVVETVSNISLGGGKNSPAEFGESIFVRLTLGAFPYINRQVSVDSDVGGLSGTSASDTNLNKDVTFSNVVDDRFPAAVTTVNFSETPETDSVSGVEYTTFTTVTQDTINVDPRLTIQWHFQKDRASFDTSFHDSTFQMLASEVGQVAARFKTARTATGVNGLSVTLTSDPTNPGTNSVASSTTATLDGEAGWSGLVDVSPAGKPGGAWVNTANVTAPSTIDADTHLVNNSQTVTVLAQNPNIGVIVGGGPSTVGAEGDHWHPGEDLLVGVGLYDNGSKTLVAPDTSPVPVVLIGRFRSDLGIVEYLDDAGAWQTVTSSPVNEIELTQSPSDSRVYVATIPASETSGWTSPTIDLFVVGIAYKGGTPYWRFAPLPVLSATANHHHDYDFDPTGLFK